MNTNTDGVSAMSAELGRVDSVRYYKASKPRPQEGDRRITKAHGLQIRIHVRAKDNQGRPLGFLMSNGRPVFEWCKPQHLPKWDRHHLTPEEQKKHFPPEREPGYMQQRGAA
jgi:hypothetical protein